MSRKTEYVRFRRAGWSAADSWRGAQTVAEFRALETDDESPDEFGAVRIQTFYDAEEFDPGDTLEPFWGADGRWRSRQELRAELGRVIERDGVHVVTTDVWNGVEWVPADSIGGCLYSNPADPVENPYVVDLMRSALNLRAVIGRDVVALP